MQNIKILKKIDVRRFIPIITDIRDYSLEKFKSDIVAAITVGIVAIPQSMAYAIIAGVQPKFGLYAAIFPAIVAAIFGASRYLAAGPTNAISMVVASSMGTAVIAGTIANTLPDEQKMAILFLLSFLVGVLQLMMGIFRFGSLINFVSHSVVVGFTAGAGVLIALNQLKNFLGINIGNHPHFIDSLKHTIIHASETNLYALSIGIFTVAFIIIAKKTSTKIPGALLAMIISAIFVVILDLENSHNVVLIGSIPQSFPPLSSFSLTLDNINALFTSVIAVAILGIVEALSIAKSIASKTGEKVDGNQEFIAQGLANITAGFTSGIPGSGSFTRSAVNYSSGARSRFAVVFSGLFILFVLLIAAPLAQYIPIASLAGILMVIAYSMIDQHAFKMAFNATAADRIVLLTTMITTLFLHLDQAVYVGVALSIMLFIRKISHPQVFEVLPHNDTARRLLKIEPKQKKCPHISIFQVEGSLFFGAIAELEEKISQHINHDSGEIFIIRLAHVHLIDATGVHAIESLMKETRSKNILILFVNLKPAVLRVFERTRMIDTIGQENLFNHTNEAIAYAVKKTHASGKCKNCVINCFKECA